MRENGFYWIKWCDKWRVAEFVNGDWYLTQCLSYLHDRDLDKIDEQRLDSPDLLK